MSTIAINPNGELTIPPAFRKKLGVMEGGELELVELGEGVFGLIAATEDIRSLKGIVRRPASPVTIEDMDKAIRRKASGI